jgi:molybdopterin-guanine dinucleotide biosynthesis protein A
VNAVVLAGGAADGVSALDPAAPNKAFVRIGGMPLVARVLETLRATPRIGRITVVAPNAARGEAALALADEVRDAGPRMLDSLAAGLAGAPLDDIVLIAPADLPILSVAAVDEFLDALASRELDVAYAILERRVHEASYPQVPHTWARLRDGTYCGGGLIGLRPRVLPRLGAFLDALGAARKSPLRLATLFGWDVLARLVIGNLRVGDAELRASTLLGAPAGAIRCTHPEVAVNVDRPSDVALANELATRLPKISV